MITQGLISRLNEREAARFGIRHGQVRDTVDGAVQVVEHRGLIAPITG